MNWLHDVTGALDWWREAGVDCTFQDAPRQWIVARDAVQDIGAAADPASLPAFTPRAAAPQPGQRAKIGGDPTTWPAELAEFVRWWMIEPSLDDGQTRARVPPRGPQAAPLMILVAEPEAADSDALLSGPQGRLLAAMLAAMAVPAEQVYVASALPRHTPMANWAELAEKGLAEVLRHHVALVQPQRLIAFGRHIPPLLTPAGLDLPLSQHTPAQTGPAFPYISHDGSEVPLLVARDLGSLLERPVAKRHFWQHWLEWSA